MRVVAEEVVALRPKVCFAVRFDHTNRKVVAYKSEARAALAQYISVESGSGDWSDTRAEHSCV